MEKEYLRNITLGKYLVLSLPWGPGQVLQSMMSFFTRVCWEQGSVFSWKLQSIFLTQCQVPTFTSSPLTPVNF